MGMGSYKVYSVVLSLLAITNAFVVRDSSKFEALKATNSEDFDYPSNGYSVQKSYQNTLASKRNPFQSFINKKEEVDEDGWRDMRVGKRHWIKAQLRKLKPKKKTVPGTLILVRHGESVWNANKTFTGWADPDLSDQGKREIVHAARLLLASGYTVDCVFTSRLKRAIRSTWILLQEMDEVYLPVFKSWRLNERMYGALTGLSKTDTADTLGHELVQEWRGSLRSRPPPLQKQDYYWPGRDRKYADLSPDQIPVTESLMDCMERTERVWREKIMFELRQGRNVMVVAHGNTLRGLVKLIDNIDDDNIKSVAIPTGIPVIYKFDEDMQPIPPQGDEETVSQQYMNGLFLEKPGVLKEALRREEEWQKRVPGYNPTGGRDEKMSARERSLNRLKAEKELGKWASQFIDPDSVEEDDGNDGNAGKPVNFIENTSSSPSSGSETKPVTTKKILEEAEEVTTIRPSLISNQPCITSLSKSSEKKSTGSRSDGYVVIIRHGKTEHNKLGLFTGWEDAPLAQDGVDEAREAGRLLKAHGFEFDVVYTSWLSRAIETAWLVVDEMDCLWLPIIKSWRLNERNYGELTGLSKQMVKQRHGENQFKAWRRGYSTAPPRVSSFSQHYPGNDRRYQKNLNDVRISVRETMIRSIESGRFTLARKLPKSESLKDCMERTIPFYTERIVPEAINQGKRVLISSSENAIRGLLMHLCDIPVEKISGLEIPNGLPIIYDLNSRCIKLLDDGSGVDPIEKYNFGKAAEFLFRPCQTENGDFDEECDIRFISDSPTLSLEEQETIDLVRPVAVGSE